MIGSGKRKHSPSNETEPHKKPCRYGSDCTTTVHYDLTKRDEHNRLFSHDGPFVLPPKANAKNRRPATAPPLRIPSPAKTLLNPTPEEIQTYEAILNDTKTDTGELSEWFLEGNLFTLQYCRFLMYVTKYVCEKVSESSLSNDDNIRLKIMAAKMKALDGVALSGSLHPTINSVNNIRTLTSEAFKAYKSEFSKIFSDPFGRNNPPLPVYKPMRDLLLPPSRVHNITAIIRDTTTNPGISPGTIRQLIETKLNPSQTGGGQNYNMIMPIMLLLATVVASSFAQ